MPGLSPSVTITDGILPGRCSQVGLSRAMQLYPAERDLRSRTVKSDRK